VSPSGRCSRYFDKPLNFGPAGDACKAHGAYLATPITFDENAHLQALDEVGAAISSGKKFAWIGLKQTKDDASKFEWVANSNTTVSYTPSKWTKKPKNAFKCVTMFLPSGEWQAQKCLRSYEYFCQIDKNDTREFCDNVIPGNTTASPSSATVPVGAVVNYSCLPGLRLNGGDATRTCLVNGSLSGSPPVCSAGCRDGWTLAGDFCYQVNGAKLEPSDAYKACKTVGATLAMPKTAAQLQALGAVMTDGSYWLGLQRFAIIDDFVWVDLMTLSDVGYSNWKSGEPSGDDGEDCVSIATTTGKWSDRKCLAKLRFICQY